MNKPYVLFINKHDSTKRFGLTRNYIYRNDLDIDNCITDRIVQVEVFDEYPYISAPDWIDSYRGPWIGIWFDYYD